MKSPYSDPAMTIVYDRIAARLQFAAPAHDLVEVAGVAAGDLVLDVGTGTGVVASAARRAAGPEALVVGVDAAMEMIRHARRETADFVISEVPVLPFRDESFDVILAGFVISHFAKYEQGLVEMVRVCRRGGRIGMTAWGQAPNPAAALWADIAAQYVPREQLNDAFLKHIPWDAWFSSKENVTQALGSAGLSAISTETRYYTVGMSKQEYLLSREASVQGLVLRDALTADAWSDFSSHVSEAFRNTFGDTVEYRRDVHFGVGTK